MYIFKKAHNLPEISTTRPLNDSPILNAGKYLSLSKLQKFLILR